jgi:hypothetical protein
MAFSLPLPPPLPAQGWKVKIRDRERIEPPHATVLHKTRAWRFGLRTLDFLDAEPDPDDVPTELVDAILADIDRLRREWDAMYPENPVDSSGEEDDDDRT